MNTIIYFYQKKGLQEPEIDLRKENAEKIRTLHGKGKTAGTGTDQKSDSQEYTLLRVGLDLQGETWFGQNMGQTVPEEIQETLWPQEPEASCRKGISGILQCLYRDRRERRCRTETQRRLEQTLAAREERIRTTEKQMRLTAERIVKRAGGEDACRYACVENLRKCPVWETWLNFLPVGEFDGYLQEFWIGQLLPYAVHPHFVILGACEDIEAVIESCARRMKSLRWILKEREYTPALREFVENFCVEYGLAISLWTVSGRTAYRKLRLDCPEPANILDFTEETAFSPANVAEGSVWLDMRSSEEKQRYLAGRGGGIVYYSLKERWGKGLERL